MARRIRRGPRLEYAVVPLVLVIGTLLLLGAGSALVAGQGASSATASPSHGTSFVASVSPSPNAPSANPTTPHPTQQPASPSLPSPSIRLDPPPTANVSPPPTADPNAAPTSAADFDVRAQVIDIAFPLRADGHYHYRDNFMDKRAGPPDTYNHARVTKSGGLVRLHDGIDIYGPQGEAVVAPFTGRVIDPATRWSPWEPDRYGRTVVIESDEPTSAGYAAVLVHLEKVWVDVGQQVARGQVIGVLGRTGNAEEVEPQLHFELRAPFEIDWSPLGEDRLVDAFNPYPSLIEADPHN